MRPIESVTHIEVFGKNLALNSEINEGYAIQRWCTSNLEIK